MDAEQERLEREIFRQRMQLGDDVDALVEKVSPRQAARRQAGRVTHAVATAKDRVMGSASDTADSVRGKADSARGTAADVSHGVHDRASDVKHSVADAADSTTEAARRRTEGNPLAAGLIAFGIGWLASSLVPASPVEKRAGSALRDRAEEPVRAAGQVLGDKAKEVAENLREPATEAAQSVKQTATDAAQDVKDTAGGHAGHLSDEAKHRAQSVKETASPN